MIILLNSKGQENRGTKALPQPTQKPKKRKVKKRRSSLFPESVVQVDLLRWLGLQHPEARRAVIRIGNEGKRTAAGHSLATALGMYSGASDLFLAFPSNGFHGLFLEIKPPGWKRTPSKMPHHQRQLDFIEHMKSLRYAGGVGVGFEGCVKILSDYLK